MASDLAELTPPRSVWPSRPPSMPLPPLPPAAALHATSQHHAHPLHPRMVPELTPPKSIHSVKDRSPSSFRANSQPPSPISQEGHPAFKSGASPPVPRDFAVFGKPQTSKPLPPTPLPPPPMPPSPPVSVFDPPDLHPQARAAHLQPYEAGTGTSTSASVFDLLRVARSRDSHMHLSHAHALSAGAAEAAELEAVEAKHAPLSPADLSVAAEYELVDEDGEMVRVGSLFPDWADPSASIGAAAPSSSAQLQGLGLGNVGSSNGHALGPSYSSSLGPSYPSSLAPGSPDAGSTHTRNTSVSAASTRWLLPTRPAPPTPDARQSAWSADSDTTAVNDQHPREPPLPALPPVRTILIFIRMFWCGQCQDYMRSLGLLDPEAFARARVRLVVVTNGSWRMLKRYREYTGSPFEILVDPKPLKLYNLFGLAEKWTTPLGKLPPNAEKPKYYRGGPLAQTARGVKDGLINLPLGDPGKAQQLGGEFIISSGFSGYKCEWAHRMGNRYDHFEAADLARVAGVSDPLKADPDLPDEHQSMVALENLQKEMVEWRILREQGMDRIRRRSSRKNRSNTDSPPVTTIQEEPEVEGHLAPPPLFFAFPTTKHVLSRRPSDHSTQTAHSVHSAAGSMHSARSYASRSGEEQPWGAEDVPPVPPMPSPAAVYAMERASASANGYSVGMSNAAYGNAYCNPHANYGNAYGGRIMDRPHPRASPQSASLAYAPPPTASPPRAADNRSSTSTALGAGWVLRDSSVGAYETDDDGDLFKYDDSFASDDDDDYEYMFSCPVPGPEKGRPLVGRRGGAALSGPPPGAATVFAAARPESGTLQLHDIANDIVGGGPSVAQAKLEGRVRTEAGAEEEEAAEEEEEREHAPERPSRELGHQGSMREVKGQVPYIVDYSRPAQPLSSPVV